MWPILLRLCHREQEMVPVPVQALCCFSLHSSGNCISCLPHSFCSVSQGLLGERTEQKEDGHLLWQDVQRIQNLGSSAEKELRYEREKNLKCNILLQQENFKVGDPIPIGAGKPSDSFERDGDMSLLLCLLFPPLFPPPFLPSSFFSFYLLLRHVFIELWLC